MKRGVIVLVLVVLVIYGGDYLWLRYRMATKRNPFGNVTVNVYYSVRLKNGKTEYPEFRAKNTHYSSPENGRP